MSMSYGDKSLEALRSLIVVVDRELDRMSPSPELLEAWAEMVRVLALGASPELRACPHCAAVGMRAATRCSQCWAMLPAVTAIANDQA